MLFLASVDGLSLLEISQWLDKRRVSELYWSEIFKQCYVPVPACVEGVYLWGWEEEKV